MAHPDPTTVSGLAVRLDTLRVEIDRIDAAMHALLIDRSAIIDELITIKTRQGGGSAFRPGREAEMMRRIAERHRGRLPLDTVESIWRVIIATFTYVQSTYAVHADMAGGDAAMRDCARFHFGFTVPLMSHFGAEGVIRAVAEAACDLGLIRIEQPLSCAPWWEVLTPPQAPKVIARLPFVERPDHPAGIPVVVVARPLAAAAARDVVLHAVQIPQWHDTLPGVLTILGAEVVGQVTAPAGVSLLLATPGSLEPQRIAEGLAATGPVTVSEIGSHAARYALD